MFFIEIGLMGFVGRVDFGLLNVWIVCIVGGVDGKFMLVKIEVVYVCSGMFELGEVLVDIEWVGLICKVIEDGCYLVLFIKIVDGIIVVGILLRILK